MASEPSYEELKRRVRDLEQVEVERKRAEEKIVRLNRVLRAISNVNQLIIRERDRDRLLQGICENFIETRGYYNAWIALWDEAGGLSATAEAGFGDEWQDMEKRLKRGELTVCGKKAFGHEGVVAIEDPPATCIDCPLAVNYTGRGAMTLRLEHGGKIYGILSVSIPAHLATDGEEQALMEEVGGDIAYALHDLELEEESRRHKEALQEAYDIINRSPAIAFLWQNREGWPVEFVSDNVRNFLSYTSEEFTSGKVSYLSLIHPDDLERVKEEVTAYSKDKKRTEFAHEPYRIVTKDGDVRWVDDRTYIRRDTEGNISHYQGIVLDITDRIKREEEKEELENQFQQAQRMESIATLAGGIAHDFNNLLMSIQGNASLMLLDKETSDPDYESLKSIEQSVQEGADLTRQLLGFARGGKYEITPIDMNELLRVQNRMFGRTTKQIEIHESCEQGIWPVKADRSQIQQVLMNLYVNASHAMPDGGHLHTQTENVILDENLVGPFEVPPGRYVKISVSDTGVGMDEKTKDRLFEPFFTTKEMGRGTGLGLASVYGIVKNHGGYINVFSQRGKGTTFCVYLPAADVEAEERQSEVDRDLEYGDACLLLVDDEDTVVSVGERLLNRLGYRVITAGSGDEALEIYQENRSEIDLVILDMIMPGISGGETYDRLKEINPGVKVLLSSGYSINEQTQEILDRGCNGFIQKPFNLEKLSQEIRDALDQG